MESLWRKQTKHQMLKSDIDYSNLENHHWDVIVVGAGLAGLLTAWYLKKEGKSVLVLEADKTASGQTERTTAKITSQHGLKYSKLVKKVGMKKARLYAQANEAAIEEYECLIKDHEIECQFERVPAYLYTKQETELIKKEGKNESSPGDDVLFMRETELLKEELKAALFLGIDAFFTQETELPFEVAGAVCFRNQAQFSPLEFIRHISAELEIWEYIKVIAIKGHQVVTENAVLTADKIVVATHYPIRNVPGFYFLRLHQERSYVLALSGCDKINGMYLGIDQDGFSLRQAGEFLLFGGGSHRTGENEKGGIYECLMQAAKEYFPNSRVETCWSAQDCMPHDGIPFIGKYSIFTPYLYVATGFQKWGMTSSVVAAIVLRDELCGRKNPYEKLFSPQRLNIRASFGNLLHDIGMSVKGLTKGILHRPNESADSLAPGHGGIVTVGGKRYACYRDEAGTLHKISARCPHMGCELTWNLDEKSWDCPCHGSRFDMDGHLLDNPAKKDSIS